MKITGWRTLLVFSVLFILSFSFPYRILPDPGQITQGFFEGLARFTGKYIFQLSPSLNYHLVSDSTGFYINAFNVFLVSLLVAIIWTLFLKRRYEGFTYFANSLTRYYLALQLLIYATSKLFKAQFYQPEPNILFTRLGEIPKDLLYWSSIGVSRPYSIFLGFAELVAAGLLLFRKTSIGGSILAIFIMLNVLAINFAYDISVKLHSGFLLFIALLQLGPNFKRTFQLMTGQTVAPMKKEIFFLPHGKSRRFACVGRIIIISLILAESFLPYLRSGNLNDDVAERPLFHGAYKVETFVLDNDTIPPLLTDTSRWRSVFIHRYHYLIIQMMDETMHERELVYDTLNKKIQLFDYDERPAGELNYYSLNDSVLELKGNWEHQQIDVSLKKIDLKKLPLIKKEFGWTIDQ